MQINKNSEILKLKKNLKNLLSLYIYKMSGYNISISGTSNDSNLVLDSESGSVKDEVNVAEVISKLQTVLTHLNTLVSNNAKTSDLTTLAKTSDLTTLAKSSDLLNLQTLEKLMNLELKRAQLLNSYTTNSMKPLKAVFLHSLAGIANETDPGMGFLGKNMFWKQVINSMRIAANNFNFDFSIRGPAEDLTNDKDFFQSGLAFEKYSNLEETNDVLDKLLDMNNDNDQLPDVLIYSNFRSDICLNKIKQLSDYGVDVYSINQNIQDTETMGATCYIGADDASSSVVLSQYLKENYDISNLVILNTGTKRDAPPSWGIRENGIRSVYSNTDISISTVIFDSSQSVVNADFSNVVSNLQNGDTLIIFVGGDANVKTATKLYSSYFKYWATFDIPSESDLLDLSNITFAGCISQNQHLQGFLPLMIARSKYDEYYKDPSNANLINLKLPPGFPLLPEEFNFINKLPTGNIVNTAAATEVISSVQSLNNYKSNISSLYV